MLGETLSRLYLDDGKNHLVVDQFDFLVASKFNLAPQLSFEKAFQIGTEFASHGMVAPHRIRQSQILTMDDPTIVKIQDMPHWF